MLKIPCSSCGAPVEFFSKAAVFAVCAHCNSTLLRHDLDVQHIGQMAVLQDDFSPIQIRTVGFFQGERFEVIGRIQKKWDAGTWNEWYLYFDGIKEGWLAEAQGFYMVSFPINLSINELPKREDVIVGQSISINSQQYTVDDIKDVTCSFSQGELPIKALQGRASTSIDLSGQSGAFACIDYSEDGVALYTGAYQEFNEFKFSNLREIDGW
jgi:Domain of unknown function (DUF4178)